MDNFALRIRKSSKKKRKSFTSESSEYTLLSSNDKALAPEMIFSARYASLRCPNADVELKWEVLGFFS